MNRAAEAIWEALQGLLPGFGVEVLATLDSTNTELMRRARAGRTEPLLLVALEQTAGRGRLGRQWNSEDALTFSLALPLQPADWGGLSLAVGVCVAEQLQALATDAQQRQSLRLKWPNDLWYQERKLAGILIETAAVPLGGPQRQVVIGIGINLRPRAAEGLRTAPACVQEFAPGIDGPALLQRLALPLVQTVLQFERAGFAGFVPRYQALDGLAQRAVQLSDGTQGVACGVGANGALLVQSAGELKQVSSAEVSVKPC